MAINVSEAERDQMLQHAQEVYPHECCGVLIGCEQDGWKRVRLVMRITNKRDDSPRNRYLMEPKEFLNAEREARRLGLEIVGIYHSHPDHPARPSEFDREHAWPYYSYIIYSVEKGTVVDAHSWMLKADESGFDEEDATGLM